MTNSSLFTIIALEKRQLLSNQYRH